MLYFYLLFQVCPKLGYSFYNCGINLLREVTLLLLRALVPLSGIKATCFFVFFHALFLLIIPGVSKAVIQFKLICTGSVTFTLTRPSHVVRH